MKVVYGILLLTVVFASAVAAQALQGNYTIAQSGGDYNSLGAAFDDLEANGVSGAVTFTFTDSATYIADSSYTLGANSTFSTNTPITGVSATNTITIEAAPGQRPVIEGSTTGAGLRNLSGRGAIAIMQSYVYIEGLEVTTGPDFGILAQGNGSISLSPTNIEVRRCIVHDVPGGPGIAYMGQNSAFADNVIFENNFVWNCMTNGVPPTTNLLINTRGSMTMRNPRNGTIMRHNTILHTATDTGTGAIASTYSSGGYIAPTVQNNIVICTSASVPAFYAQLTGLVPAPASCDFNYWFAGTQCNVTPTTFAAWQGAGLDTNGSDQDPLLVSTTGTIDLHLLPTSPCIDPAGQTSTATVDVEGDIRPKGVSNDIGADEAGDPPDMTMEYNAAPVVDGGTVPVGDARTQVGDVFTFTIGNTGLGDLYLVGTPPVTITPGANIAGTTGIQTQPTLTVIPQNQSTTFVLFVEPAALGQFSLTIEILNNDSTKNPFDFTVEGTGILPNDEAQADIAAGSSFGGPPNGPFTVAVDPGAALANAEIELTDVDLDPIDVIAITPLTSVPTGITPPTAPATPAHPVLLAWTGTAEASNPPGDYTWEIEFADTVNLTTVIIEVTITINDLQPTHTILDASSGDGSSGDPYAVNYFPGATGALAVDLATVTDPNTSQTLNLSGVVQVSGPSSGTGFQFSLSAGVLNIAPAGTLVQDDAGNQSFTLVVEDGTHTVLIRVDAFVFGSSGSMFFLNSPTLPTATIDTPYGPETLMVQGGTSPYTFNEVSGTWPAGITLDTNTGEISGTPTELGTFSMEVRVIDANNDTLTETFTLTVMQQVSDAGDGTTRTENNGCSSTTGGTSLLLLALLAGLTGLRYARSRT